MADQMSQADVMRVLQLLNNGTSYPVADVAMVLGVQEHVIQRLAALARMVVPELNVINEKKIYTSSEAADAVGVSKSTLYRIFDELKDEGFEIEREQQGRRSVRVITDEAIHRAKEHIARG